MFISNSASKVPSMLIGYVWHLNAHITKRLWPYIQPMDWCNGVAKGG